MALAYAQYLGNNSTRVFNVPFPYLHKDHIQVKVNAVPVTYTWNNDTQVNLDVAPATDAIVDVRRVTPRDTLLVDFLDGSTLVESDLDLASIQVFYLAQEAFDLGEASLGVTDDGSFSALNRRISNVAPPIAANDVVNKVWAETGMTSQLAIATSKATEAGNHAAGALASKNSADAKAAAAATSETNAGTKATAAATSATEAKGYRDTASTKAAEAAASAVEAKGYRDTASTKATEAAASAQQAATFDPANFYTKTQMDAQLGTNGRRNLTISTSDPTAGQGVDGDVWYKI